jgi:L-alanine-DL-glutamate epimerase-like enolase superfamily enzyme
MKITRVKAIPYFKLQTKTPGWKMALSQKVHDEESVTFVRIDTDQEIFGVGVTNPGLMILALRNVQEYPPTHTDSSRTSR